MRLLVLAIAGLSRIACASAQTPPAPAADTPVLYDATDAGGRVSNANGPHAAEAARLAADHCAKSGKEMRVTGITADRNSLIFSCIAK